MTRPRATIAIQARMGSSRLPGKVARPFGSRPMLSFQLARLEPVASRLAARGIDLAGVVVATSDLVRDDAVADLATSAGVALVRGSEDDVLGRVAGALDAHPADHLVRLTADCPWTDPGVVAEIVAAHVAGGADYTSNTLLRTWPDGLDVEVLSAGALTEAIAGAQAGPEREHVTPFLQRHPERFSLAQVVQDRPLGDLRWTVDTEDDLDALRAAATEADATTAPWQALLARLPGQPHHAGSRSLRPLPADGGSLRGESRSALDSARSRWATSITAAAAGHALWRSPAGSTFERAWLLEPVSEPGDTPDPLGWIGVSVSAGGEAEVTGWWPVEEQDDALALLDRVLAADAQVARLRPTRTPNGQTGPR